MNFETYKKLLKKVKAANVLYNKKYVDLITKYSSIFDYTQELEKYLHNFDKNLIEISGRPEKYCKCFTSIESEKGILCYSLCEDDYYSLITIIEFEIPFDDVFKIKNVDDLKNYVTDRDKLTEGDLRNLCKLLKKINHTKPLSIITNGLKNRCRKILKRNKID